MKSWRTTVAGICTMVGSTLALIALLLQRPLPPWAEMFAAVSGWSAAMASGIGHVKGADDKVVQAEIEASK